MAKAKVLTVLRILISIVCIAGLIWLMQGKGSYLKYTLTKTHLGWLFLGIFTQVVCLIILSVRMMIIFKTQGFSLSLKESLYLNLIGVFFNNFLPTATGGDVVKAMVAGGKSGRILESFVSCFADRLIGMFSLVTLATIALFSLYRGGLSRELWWGAGILIGVGMLIMVIFFNTRVFNRLTDWLNRHRLFFPQAKIERITSSLKSLRQNHRYLYQAFLLSLFSQLLGILTNYILALSLKIDVSVVKFFLIMPVIGLASMIPSLNGLGVREMGYVVFFRNIVSKEEALALSLLWLGLLYLASLLGGILYLFKGGYRLKNLPSKNPDLT